MLIAHAATATIESLAGPRLTAAEHPILNQEEGPRLK